MIDILKRLIRKDNTKDIMDDWWLNLSAKQQAEFLRMADNLSKAFKETDDYINQVPDTFHDVLCE